MTQPRFLELDGLRGIAAFAILVFHFSDYLADRNLLPSAYLAVDFFFILSGFVLDFAYGPRLARGQAFGRFIRARLTRLYPLYLLGLVLGLVYLGTRLILSPMQGLSGGEIAQAALLSALFLPNLAPPVPLHGSYPLNLPAWSLALEIGINIVFAAIFPWLTLRRLGGVVILGGLILMAVAFAAGSVDLGPQPETLPGGVARVLFGFFAGVLLHRLFQRFGAAAVPVVPSWALMAVLCVIVAVELHGPARLVFDLVVTLLVFPAMIWLGAAARSWAPAAGPTAYLGRISYALYILHFPILMLMIGVTRGPLKIDPLAWKPWSGFCFMAVTLLACHLVDRTLEERLRFWATRFQRRRAAAMAEAAARAENPP